LVTAAGDKITLNMFTEDTQALEKLGLAPGEFDRVADRMMLAREVRNPNPGRRVMPNRAGDQAADELKFAFKVHGMNTAEFAELELASAQLAAKIRAGKSYRFPNILEEIAKEDCFKELQLNAKFDSFAKIDEAYTRLNHAKLPPGQQARVDRAHLFLKGYLEGHPEAATQAFTLVEAQERKLVEALGRKRFADVLWKSISPADLAKNPSAVGAP
jgi:hypothetical protein